MEFTIVIVIIGIVLYFATRKKNAISTTKQSKNTQQKAPRDFLGKDSGYLNTPKPLRELLEENESGVKKELARILVAGGTYERKYAAFALGQIGDSNFILQLEQALEEEKTTGINEAIGAALAALRQAPAEKGYSDMDKRIIIQRVY